MQGNLNVDSLKKSAGNGHINSPVSGPIKNQTTTEQTKKNTQKHNKNKTQSTERWDRYQLWKLRCTMTSCVSSCVWPPKKKQNKEDTKQHKGAMQEGDRSKKALCGNRGSPSQDPRDHREQTFRHNVHPGTSKQTTTTPCRNESGEKWTVKQEVKNDLMWERQQELRHSGRTQSPLSSSFPSILSSGAHSSDGKTWWAWETASLVLE